MKALLTIAALWLLRIAAACALLAALAAGIVATVGLCTGDADSRPLFAAILLGAAAMTDLSFSAALDLRAKEEP